MKTAKEIADKHKAPLSDCGDYSYVFHPKDFEEFLDEFGLEQRKMCARKFSCSISKENCIKTSRPTV